MDLISKAQNSTVSVDKVPRLAPFRFKKGQSGNLKGRPRKETQVTKIYQKILRKAKNRKQIEAALMGTLTEKGMAKVLLLREMAERTEGKVADVVDMNVSGKISLEQVLEAKKKAAR